MYKSPPIIKEQIYSYTKLLSKKKAVDKYQVFLFRGQLRQFFEGDKLAISHLNQIVGEAETSLQNILNFYPHN